MNVHHQHQLQLRDHHHPFWLLPPFFHHHHRFWTTTTLFNHHHPCFRHYRPFSSQPPFFNHNRPFFNHNHLFGPPLIYIISTGRLRATTTSTATNGPHNGWRQQQRRTGLGTGLNVEADDDKKARWVIFFILRVYFIQTKLFCFNLGVNHFTYNIVPGDGKTGPNDMFHVVRA